MMIASEKNRRYSILAVVVLTAACIAGMVGGTALQTTLTRQRALDFATQAAAHLSTVAAEAIKDALAQADTALGHLAQHARDEGGRPVTYFLRDHWIARPQEALVVVDAEGRVTATRDLPAAVPTDAFFPRHRDFPGSEPVTTVVEVAGEPRLVLSRRLEDKAGAFRGVAAIALRLDHFDRMLRGGESVSRAALYLSSGQRVAPASAEVFFPPAHLAAFPSAPQVRPVAGTDLVVAGFVNEDEALRWWRADTAIQVPIVALFVLVLGVGAGMLVAAINRDFRHQRDRLAAMTDVNTELERLITERTRDLQAARSSAEKASSAKSRFLAAAAHDLRQPLQALVMFLDELAYRPLGTAEQAILRKVEVSAQSLSSLLNGLLDIGAIDSGMIEPRCADVSLAPILDGIEAKFRAPAEAKGLRLAIVPTALSVRTDPVLLARILANLVSNAVRYTEQGGVVVGCRRQGGDVLVQVVDSGIGIAPELLPLVFEEYYQVANAGRDRRRGTGLGLAIVERLSGLLGHEVAVRSRPGRGSAFSVRLPLASTRPAEEGEPRCAPAVDGKGALVVVVEDDPEVRQSLERSLRNRRYAVLPAASGRAAVELLRWAGRPPAAIVADYRLAGGETGLAVIAALRALAPAQDIVTILLTGEQMLDEPLPEGLTLLRKPIAPAALCAAIERLRRPDPPPP